MFYEEAAKTIENILVDENLNFTDSFMKVFLSIISEMCNYTEEDHKIRPQIILGNKLGNYFDTISPHNYFIMYIDNANGDGLSRIFKSLALFCDNGWYIVINNKGDKIEYGIFRRYTNIAGERFEDYFQESYAENLDCHMIIIKARNNFEISLTRFGKTEDFIISQRLIQTNDSRDYEKVYDELADDILMERNDYDPTYVKKCFMKMLRSLPQKVHGTIMLVVKDNFNIDKTCLAGITISPSIDYYEAFVKYERVENYQEAENIYSLTGILCEMLNTDGITIITTKGRVLYYNVFYEGEVPKEIRGGARKRTAKGILKNDTLKDIVGVYFQSQDGEVFYEKKEK